MKSPRFLCVVLSVVVFPPAVVSADSGSPLDWSAPASVDRIYASASPAIVGITCQSRGRPYFGTGVLIDPSGLVLTSVTVVPRGVKPSSLFVYLRGSRKAPGRLLLSESNKEVSLIRIRGVRRLVEERGKPLPYLKLGDSGSVGIGDPVYTLGNSFHSIELDDQVCVAAGVVSGLFHLDSRRRRSGYRGPTIETSAALNNGVDGGPLVDERGAVIGLLSLNFSRSRWLGTAIPIDEIKPLIARHRGWFDDTVGAPGLAWSRAYIGVELEEIESKEIRVLRLKDGGPAFQAGLEVGDRIDIYDGEKLESMAQLIRLIGETRPGKTVRLSVERDGKAREFDLKSWGRF